MLDRFRNETPLDFSRRDVRSQMTSALKRVRTQLGVEYNLIIGGDRVKAPEQFASTNPAKADETIALFQQATGDMSARAVDAAAKSAPEWRATDPETRTNYLLRAAGIATERRAELNAWLVLEAGMTWADADAEATLAIDYLRYHAHRVRGEAKNLTVPRSTVSSRRHALSPVAVLPSWQAPLSSLAGMVSAAVAAGSTTVIKPSYHTPTIARQLVAILLEAGVPANVLSFITSRERDDATALATHPRTRAIAFAGAHAVAHRVRLDAAGVRDGRIVCLDAYERGDGLVDRGVDPAEVAGAILAAAFRFQGQSARSSGVYVVDTSVFDDVADAVVSGVRALRIGSPEDPDVTFGPVIDRAHFDAVMTAIVAGRDHGRMIAGGEGLSRDGVYVQPTVLAFDGLESLPEDVPAPAPIVSLVRVSALTDALPAIARRARCNCTVHSKNEDLLKDVAARIPATRLYVNGPAREVPVGDGVEGSTRRPDWLDGLRARGLVVRGSS